ncbi:hypothetical protein [Paracoccus tegillarcae]|uniref:hypothetical protein n=1 Tax=Paracoccus tegillarcae TaxID=1529068 RepID=UPI00130046B3|nr:hypothetical protein [Paracoccus tegillarcae]
MFYELRDHPDDLPIRCETLTEARKRARQRVERFGMEVLIYEVCSFEGEKLVEAVS